MGMHTLRAGSCYGTNLFLIDGIAVCRHENHRCRPPVHEGKADMITALGFQCTIHLLLFNRCQFGTRLCKSPSIKSNVDQ